VSKEPQNESSLAFGELFPQVYEELKSLAHRQLYRDRNQYTLNTTALVHEAYMKMASQEKVEFANQKQFFALAAQAMRRILISRAREKMSQKRGGDQFRVTFGDDDIALQSTAEEILHLHEALERFSGISERQARVVEYRFFGGFKHEEIAKIMELSVPSVRRDWRLAKAWLSRELKKEQG
jgi:RNA polymerase sigma factor (TIGR02999 family)